MDTVTCSDCGKEGELQNNTDTGFTAYTTDDGWGYEYLCDECREAQEWAEHLRQETRACRKREGRL